MVAGNAGIVTVGLEVTGSRDGFVLVYWTTGRVDGRTGTFVIGAEGRGVTPVVDVVIAVVLVVIWDTCCVGVICGRDLGVDVITVGCC